MPSGSEEPQRDPELKRKAPAGGISWLCRILGSRCVIDLEILGLKWQ